MAQMGITLRRLDLCMPQKALHLVQATPRVDQETGIRMPQVVDADISQAGFGSRRIPSAKDGHIGLERLGVSKHPLTVEPRQRLEQANHAIGHGHESRLAQLCGVDAPMAALEVKVLPACVQHPRVRQLTTPCRQNFQ